MKHLLFICLFVVSWNVGLAENIKLSKLKVPTAKKVKVPKAIEVDSVLFKKVKDHKYEDSSYGSARTFRAEEMPEMIISLYVYPMNNLEVSAEHYMPYEFHQLNTGIHQAYELDGFKVAELNNELLSVNDKQLFYSKHTLQSENSSLITESYLSNNHLHFVKVRMTFPSIYASKMQPISRVLVEKLINNIEVTEDADSSLQVSIKTIEDNEAVRELSLSFQLVYSISLMNAFSDFDMILSFDEIKAAIENVIKINASRLEEGDLNIDSEKIFTLIDLSDADLLDEFIWEGLQQPHWTQPDNLQKEQLKLWLAEQEDKIFVPFSSNGLLRANYGRE
ncbi:MAG: hypothetical protein R3E90_13530 [Marinicella sp.]